MRLHSRPVIVLGIIFGIVTAWGHSFAYLASRWFTVEGHGRPTQLLAVGHLQLGVLSAAALPLVWPSELAWDWSWAGPVLIGTVALAISQASLFAALRHTDASAVAPLLSLKIAVLAAVAWIGFGEAQTPLQILGVALAVLGALLLNGLGGRPPWRALGWAGVTILGYATCDTTINIAIEAIIEQTGVTGVPARLNAGVAVAAMVYGAAGVLAGASLPWFGSRDPQLWRRAVPYVASWALAMIGLYCTFALLGAVYGAILQNTRALWSIVLGAVLAHRGWAHLETPHGRGVLAARILAALFLIGAVGLYALGKIEN